MWPRSLREGSRYLAPSRKRETRACNRHSQVHLKSNSPTSTPFTESKTSPKSSRAPSGCWTWISASTEGTCEPWPWPTWAAGASARWVCGRAWRPRSRCRSHRITWISRRAISYWRRSTMLWRERRSASRKRCRGDRGRCKRGKILKRMKGGRTPRVRARTTSRQLIWRGSRSTRKRCRPTWTSTIRRKSTSRTRTSCTGTSASFRTLRSLNSISSRI